jgi:hypothetical protein
LQEWGEKEIEENCGGVNSSKIYFKNFCKCHNVPPPSIKINKIKRNKIEISMWGQDIRG